MVDDSKILPQIIKAIDDYEAFMRARDRKRTDAARAIAEAEMSLAAILFEEKLKSFIRPYILEVLQEMQRRV